MEMDSFEELSESNDHRMIIRGKRTKRQRPLSPAGLAAVKSCSSSGGESGCSEVGGRDRGVHIYSLIPSSTGSSDISSSTEEDEDMANCLILLAQGGCIRQEEEEVEKLISSRRFNEIVTTTSGKAGFYMYECKTCNRTFLSFQALGGHRASHKKPKAMVEEKKSIDATSDDQNEEEEDGGQFHRLSDHLPMAMGLSNKRNNKPKIHECSICGSQFSSGQALGGHMRRHRNPTSSKVINADTSPIESEKPGNIFPLDLNLPAPEDDHRDLKFQFASNQQHIVLSAPALVDCHY